MSTTPAVWHPHPVDYPGEAFASWQPPAAGHHSFGRGLGGRAGYRFNLIPEKYLLLKKSKIAKGTPPKIW